ncbi:MAG: polysaccharide biosynthesis/export family protein [candidate division KSB1 bacterium]|nr:polysaccharide biosynthesis/export family protein [candidate division KSB1 bacterium]MDZ7272790.1 polysaccharide biosynthesis/export family protein [candidate division KSB1 bacterium]MDZ7284186.1 polysaccharide biosynthesis/export family protein [candidate division KSB1 bacterium]MDZ7297416.1 polysaccharide biosynthesis/export family protein [candidate division KSB1 bacterium]MDZ7306524.1 polysaccharide biosynthesis/export family protein [candidate division KSB1 bacterium]
MNLIRRPLGLLVLLSLAGFTGAARAQDYVLEKGDVIQVAFWQEPSLNTQARIDAEGKIDLPLIGRVPAGGKTIAQLSSSIVEKISVYNKKITQATVTVIEYGSRAIYISGAVARPGRYTFQELPNVWKAILEAGGPAANAQLSQVQIFRGGETASRIETVDVTSAFESGNVKDLPRLQPGDYLNVPSITPPTAGGGAEGGMSPTAIAGNPRNAIYVFGMVARPGVYPFEKDLDVLQAIVRAGGPAMMQTSSNNRAPIEPDLRRVRLISLGAETPVVYVINIKDYTKQAAPLPLPLRPGDTIYIPGRANYGSFILANTLVQVLTGTVSILTSYLLLNTLLGQN